MARDIAAEMRERWASFSADQKEKMRRALSGDDERDQVSRGAVFDVIRSLRGRAPSLEYQKALRDVQIAVSDLDVGAKPSHKCIG